MQVSGGEIQWQYSGDTLWTTLIDLSSLVGPQGPAGVNGSNGTDGRSDHASL